MATSIGAVTALATSAIQSVAAIPPSPLNNVLLSLLAGVCGAALSIGVMKAQIDSAHEKLREEKAAREREIDAFKETVNATLAEIKQSQRDIFSILRKTSGHSSSSPFDMT